MIHSRNAAKFIVATLFFVIGNTSNTFAQRGPLPTWKVLAEESRAVVAADVVEGNLQVIDPVKKAKVETGPDGKLSFGNPALFTVGILGRVRITAVLKSDGKVRQGDTIGVFVEGYYGSDLPTVPQTHQKYVFFLRPVEAGNKAFTSAVIQRIERKEENGHPRYTEHREKFDAIGYYTPVREGFAQILIPPENLKLIDEIKKALAEHP